MIVKDPCNLQIDFTVVVAWKRYAQYTAKREETDGLNIYS